MTKKNKEKLKTKNTKKYLRWFDERRLLNEGATE
jgi:hypothetical protein